MLLAPNPRHGTLKTSSNVRVKSRTASEIFSRTSEMKRAVEREKWIIKINKFLLQDEKEPFSSPCFHSRNSFNFFFSGASHLYGQWTFLGIYDLLRSSFDKSLNILGKSRHCSSSFRFPRSSCFANEFAISLISERARWTLLFCCWLLCTRLCFKFNDYAAAYTKNQCVYIRFNWNKFYFRPYERSFVSPAREPKAAKCSKF